PKEIQTTFFVSAKREEPSVPEELSIQPSFHQSKFCREAERPREPAIFCSNLPLQRGYACYSAWKQATCRARLPSSVGKCRETGSMHRFAERAQHLASVRHQRKIDIAQK